MIPSKKKRLNYLCEMSPLQIDFRNILMKMIKRISSIMSNSKNKLAIMVMQALPNVLRRHSKTKLRGLLPTRTQLPIRHHFQPYQDRSKNPSYLQRASTECLAQWNRQIRRGGPQWSRGGTIIHKVRPKKSIGPSAIITLFSPSKKSRLLCKHWKTFMRQTVIRLKK